MENTELEIIEHYKNLSLENIHSEVWESISGYDGMYQVSSMGRIKSLARIDKLNHPIQLRILKQDKRRGYLCVTLSNDIALKRFPVHLLVLRAFHPNPESRPEGNHKRGIKTDNRETELEWSTKSENILHAYRVGLMKPNKPQLGKFGAMSSRSKPIVQKSISGQIIKIWESGCLAASKLKLPQENINAVCRGRRTACGGFKWEYQTSNSI